MYYLSSSVFFSLKITLQKNAKIVSVAALLITTSLLYINLYYKLSGSQLSKLRFVPRSDNTIKVRQKLSQNVRWLDIDSIHQNNSFASSVFNSEVQALTFDPEMQALMTPSSIPGGADDMFQIVSMMGREEDKSKCPEKISVKNMPRGKITFELYKVAPEVSAV